MNEKIDPNTINWEKFTKIFPYMNKKGGEINVTDVCPVCGELVDHMSSLLHIKNHGKDPTYGIEYEKALDVLAYLQITINNQERIKK